MFKSFQIASVLTLLLLFNLFSYGCRQRQTLESPDGTKKLILYNNQTDELDGADWHYILLEQAAFFPKELISCDSVDYDHHELLKWAGNQHIWVRIEYQNDHGHGKVRQVLMDINAPKLPCAYEWCNGYPCKESTSSGEWKYPSLKNFME